MKQLWSLFLLFGLISCYPPCPSSPSHTLLTGQVKDWLNGENITGASVALQYHDREMYQEGLWIGKRSFQQADTIIRTDKNGHFELPVRVQTDGLPTYVWLRISQPGYEPLHEVFLHIGVGKELLGEMALRKSGQFGEGQYEALRKARTYQPPKRESDIFRHSSGQLKKLYPPEELAQLPSIADCPPEGGYVRFFAPTRGYNRQSDALVSEQWSPYTNLLLPMDLAMAGVAEGEVGQFTDHPEALKSQIIWSRTYALYKGKHLRKPQNLQMAFQTTLTESMIQASLATSKLVLTHHDARGGFGWPIQTVFSARCNGDFTQPGERAKWQGCKVGGFRTPYLRAVACSKHPNCDQANLAEAPCCPVDAGQRRYLYGHGAGGCQHGMRDFAEQGWSFRVISPYYFYGSILVPFEQDVWQDEASGKKQAGRGVAENQGSSPSSPFPPAS